MNRKHIRTAVTVALIGISGSALSAGFVTPSGGYLSDEQLMVIEQRQAEPVSPATLDALRRNSEQQARESNQIAD